jgi:hypothetical protein
VEWMNFCYTMVYCGLIILPRQQHLLVIRVGSSGTCTGSMRNLKIYISD